MREIEEEEQREVALLKAEQERERLPNRYIITAGAFRDQEVAKEKLIVLLDRGYDGELRTAVADGAVLFELRVGPYGTLRQAEKTAEVLGDAFGLATSVILLPSPPSEDTGNDEVQP